MKPKQKIRALEGVLLVGIIVIIAWPTTRALRRAQEQKKAIAEIEKRGGHVFGDPVTAISIEGFFTVEELACLHVFPELTSLGLVGANSDRTPTYPGKVLMLLEKMERLRRLNLFGVEVTDDDLRYLRNCHDLKELYIYADGLTSIGLQHLKGFKKLRKLSLCKGDFTSVDWSVLMDLESLQALDLSGSRFGNSGLRNISLIPMLEELRLDDTDIGDGGLQVRAHCRNGGFLAGASWNGLR